MKNNDKNKQNKKVLIIGGLIFIVVIIGGFVRENTHKRTIIYTPSPTIAGQSATLTPIGSRSATPIIFATPKPYYTMPTASQSSHPQQPKN